MSRRKLNTSGKGLNRVESDTNIDFETMVRMEFTKLHRQYRLMEDARHAIAGASGKLSQQGKVLVALRQEKDNLNTDLVNADCQTYQNRDLGSIKTILEALERYEKFKADIKQCLIDIEEMEANVDKITKRLIVQKLKIQSLFGLSMTVSHAEHRMAILENRLYHVTTLFDTLISKNKGLRIEIDMMLKLRGQFFRRILAIKKMSIKIKSRMGEVVYEATQAYEQRDDWVNKMNILRDRNDKDSRQHVLEIKEYQRILHNDAQIHQFMASKNKRRQLLESSSERNQRKNEGKVAELDILLESYKISFNSILKLAASRNIETLVNHYMEKEQRNYTIFKYTTNLNHETSSLMNDITNINNETEERYIQHQQACDEQDEILAEKDAHLENVKAAFQEVVNEWKITDQQMEEFGNVLDTTFNAAECSNHPILTLLGNRDGMRPHNICLCMSVLEHRISQLIFERGKLEIRKACELDGKTLPKKPQLWTQGAKPRPMGGPFKPKVVVTGRLDTEQDEDEGQEQKGSLQWPMYYKEIKTSLRNRVKPLEISQARIDIGSAADVTKDTSVIPTENPSDHQQTKPVENVMQSADSARNMENT